MALPERSRALVRILLADDHTLVRQGIDLQPDVAVLDIGMPRLNGLEAAGPVARRAPTGRDQLAARADRPAAGSTPTAGCPRPRAAW